MSDLTATEVKRMSDWQCAVRQRMEFRERRAQTKANAFWRRHGFKVGLAIMALSAASVVALIRWAL